MLQSWKNNASSSEGEPYLQREHDTKKVAAASTVVVQLDIYTSSLFLRRAKV